MSLQLKIKDENGNFSVLKNIKNLRFALHNNQEEIKSIYSFGWKRMLNFAGSRYVVIRINGIIDSMNADKLLRDSAMQNSINDYEIEFNNGEKIKLQCSVELYERYYDPTEFDSFSVVLASTGIINIAD
ncbi:phage tail tube protein [Wolbachia endosymbiont of Pentidionis agamae]|uniref:phage tail tube protein n=1 Tax=Wolbachia endosymbiont of Pentidionis agamae TaxID=3110435 RepID=UPI002FD2163E